MLVVNNVTKEYNGFTALEEINLEFHNGVYGLLAPNGAGKTTLIKMITTLLFPTKGQILWDGTDIRALDEKYRDIIGYLPQNFGYYKNYSPRQFLEYLAALKGIERNISKSKIIELLELVALGDVIDKKMRKLSGGMIQRVGIAQALLNDPRILILDEPTAGLDPNNSPANICNTLMGKIYETWKIENVKVPHIMLTQRQEGDNTLVRFACDAEYTGEAHRVTPTLEDVFLYVYNDGV